MTPQEVFEMAASVVEGFAEEMALFQADKSATSIPGRDPRLYERADRAELFEEWPEDIDPSLAPDHDLALALETEFEGSTPSLFADHLASRDRRVGQDQLRKIIPRVGPRPVLPRVKARYRGRPGVFPGRRRPVGGAHPVRELIPRHRPPPGGIPPPNLRFREVFEQDSFSIAARSRRTSMH